jgi:hypothetical protein
LEAVQKAESVTDERVWQMRSLQAWRGILRAHSDEVRRREAAYTLGELEARMEQVAEELQEATGMRPVTEASEEEALQVARLRADLARLKLEAAVLGIPKIGPESPSSGL